MATCVIVVDVEGPGVGNDPVRVVERPRCPVEVGIGEIARLECALREATGLGRFCEGDRVDIGRIVDGAGGDGLEGRRRGVAAAVEAGGPALTTSLALEVRAAT